MKMLLSVLVFMGLVGSAHAGSANCTNVTHVTAAGNYTASSSDCIISVDKSTFEGTLVYLPANPSVGDEFTVRDNTSAQQCDESSCWPPGVGATTVGAAIQISDGYDTFNTDWMADFHQQGRYIYNGTVYEVTSSYYSP